MSERSGDQPANVAGEVSQTSVHPLGRTEVGKDGKLEIQAFLVTLSPKEDIEDRVVQAMLKWLKQHCIMSYAVIEHGRSGKKHLHALMITKEPREKKRLHDDFWRKVARYHPTSIGSIAVKVQTAPGNDWYHDYLRKEEGVEIIKNDWDAERAERYFPTPEEQAFLMAAYKNKSVNAYYEDLKTKWIAMYPEDDTYESAIRFIHRRMFDGDMRAIVDDRKVCQLAMYLHRFRKNEVEPTEVHMDYYKKHYVPRFDFSHP